ncbi:protein FAM43B [Anolis carolinensis]|uniref:protein FAM43B n=1 Tax=Anolis carolinensis TaxID=28377 RepID=UPI002F2B751D
MTMAAMLPWRRSKFVLVEDGVGSVGGVVRKAKSLGPALSYGSLLSNLLRSCPDLWPECPSWPRLGGRRQKAELNPEEPSCSAWYLGNAVTLQAKGEGCTADAVDKIWAKSDRGARGTKMTLSAGQHGLRMSPANGTAEKDSSRHRGRLSHAYLLPRITYCAPDLRRPRILTWVYRHQVKNKAVVLRCHAALLSRPEKARALARHVAQASCSALDEFKRLKRQSDARQRHRQLWGDAGVPAVPLRKLLNGKCPYRAAPEKGRNGNRLSAIKEEEEEKEEQKEQDEEEFGLFRLERAEERTEVAALAREMRFCTLRGRLHRRPDTPCLPW